MREIDIGETGSYGIADNDVNTDGVWSNEETGRQSFSGTGNITVGTDVMSVALGNANEAAGGLKTTDMGAEGKVSRRESRRAPRGFDDPEMDRESYTLAVGERIESEAEADRRSTALAERFESVSEKASEEDEHIAGRGERCRNEVTADSYYSQTTSDTTPEVDTIDNPWDELTQEQVANINQSAQRLADKFECEVKMKRASIAHCLAYQVADGKHIANATIGVKENIEQIPEVNQSIESIDPFKQITSVAPRIFDSPGSKRYTPSGKPILKRGNEGIIY